MLKTLAFFNFELICFFWLLNKLIFIIAVRFNIFFL